MVKLKQHSIGYVCEDDIPIVLRLTRDGRMWFNQTEVSPNEIGERVAEVVRSRQEFAVYVMADSQVSYSQFINFLDRLYGAIPALRVILVTDTLRERLMGPPVVTVRTTPQEYPPGCDVEWKENGFRAPSMDENDLASAH